MKEQFFTHNREFYKTFFSMMLVLALQNLVAYSVNMADNIMLGSYDQNALSGAATVNQIFFMVQQFALAFGNALVVLASQYWGEGRKEPIRVLTGIALKAGLFCGIVMIVLCTVMPEQLLRLFTNAPEIISQGLGYLNLLKWTFALYIITNILMAALRSAGIVNISFYISLVSLIVNVAINYTLIFGRFGMPEMGIMGAAVGTLAARILELMIVVVYIFHDKKIALFKSGLFKKDVPLRRDYIKAATPIILAQVLWGVSVPMQTAILGHLSDDAIAANSVATTFYQYLKVIVIAMTSASAVMMGNGVGRGDMKKIRSEARTLAVIDVVVGVILGAVLFVLKNPLLSMYQLSGEALRLADHLIVIMSFVMVGMSYQMPVSAGIIQGGGDTKFNMLISMISTWVIVMPLSFAAAFWWKLPVELVVIVIQSDQFFKGIPAFIRFRSYRWVKKLTNECRQ